jgi:S-phase kinase-associated protein 1
MHAQVDDVGELTPVPLPLVSSSTLSKVIEYMRFHFDNPTENDATSAWDARFIEVEYPIMYDLIIAANYLDIKSLLDLGCKRIASIVRGKTPDEIRAEFNIVNDLTPEEQAQIVKENTWVADN